MVIVHYSAQLGGRLEVEHAPRGYLGHLARPWVAAEALGFFLNDKCSKSAQPDFFATFQADADFLHNGLHQGFYL